MTVKSGRASIGAIGAALLWAGAASSFAADSEVTRSPSDLYGPRTSTTPLATTLPEVVRRSGSTADTFRYWNQIAIDASGLDHTPVVAGGESHVFGEQLGPGRSARAMAIVHIAMFDAVNSIVGGYRSYTGLAREFRPASVDAAIAAAAHDTLIRMFPSQKPRFDSFYTAEIARLPPALERQKNVGIAVGKRAAARILALRANDGSVGADPLMTEWPTSNAAGHWRQDPVARQPIAS